MKCYVLSLLVLCIFAPLALEAVWSPGFKVRYDIEGIGETSFLDMPQSDKAAQALGWVPVKGPEGPAEYSSLRLWCPKDDYTVGVWYDDTGYAYGLQIALLQDYLSDMVFDLDVVGMTNWTTTVLGEPKNYWAISQYFASPEKLAQDPKTRSESRDSSKFLQEPEIYLTGPLKKIYKVNTDPKTYNSNSFTTQKCIDGMGIHYYYNMTDSLECKSENMFPWFIIEDGGQCTGTGFFTYGLRTIPDGKLNYMERYYLMSDLERTFNTAPECVFKNGNSPGLVEVHIYYVDTPYNITCSTS